MDYLTGGFVMFVGVVYILVGRQMAKKMKQLRESLAWNSTIRAKFQEADIAGNGQLSIKDFAVLTESLNMGLTRPEREVAFLTMDKKDTGLITYDDFQAWWLDSEVGSGVV
jgi:Ca2+-binding EF-hand superfamily protein